ncbi:amino acid adenylation domain-containing protein [Streptomyces sp. NPDC008121]|uniref:amino acid adenylation domain-containing protein n=1 Tax=Streptomyces sp. NPDC008121 TaxID=3364809 RepID=UPI0036E7B76E
MTARLESAVGPGAAWTSGLVARFEERAALEPSAVAVRGDGPALTYGELNERANRVAHWLIDRGIGPEDTVAVALPSSPDLVAALLGTLKAGAMYLPLDPGYPSERLAYMTADARPRALVTTPEVAPGLGPVAPSTAVLVPAADLAAPKAGGPGSTGARGNPTGRFTGPEQGAYTIYTSGSTGRPKGVVVTHRSLGNFLAFMSAQHGVHSGDVVLSTTPISFDIAGLELYLPLVNGATLHLVPRETTVDGAALRRRLAEARPTLVQGTPALWQLLREAGWTPAEVPAGTRLLCGGEALPRDLADFLSADGHAEVWNLYGPTETTIWSLVAPVRAGEPVTIGTPMWNTGVHVLDERLAPVAPGEPGELYLSGDGLARGYHGRPALTAERFVACPFGGPGTRMYRTGDVVRRRADGALDFLGRVDEQVKIHGYRIELGEIEEALRRLPEVAQARVVVRDDAPGTAPEAAAPAADRGNRSSGNRHLAGYVVPAPGRTPDPVALREALRAWLPAHMVPAGIAVLDRFPLTPAGKVDRKALPALEFAHSTPYRAPATDRERALVDLFREVLRVDRVGTDDSFFDLGGNSLLATRLVARVRSALAVELPLRTVFEDRTPAALALRLDGGAPARPAPRVRERGARVPVSYAQQRLWFLHRLEGPSTTYNLPIAVRLTGEPDLDALRAAVDHLLVRHESLRTYFAEGEQGAEQIVVPAEEARVDVTVHDVPVSGLRAAVDRAAGHLFDLAAEIPVRVDLFRTGPQDHVLLLCIHHIASDGWSLAPLVRDLCDAYTAHRAHVAPDRPPLGVQYVDYTLWQRELLGSADDPDSTMSRQLAYWRERLAGAPELLDLPTDRPRPALATFRGDVVPFDVPAELTERLQALARRERASLFMVLQAAAATLLTKLGAGTDIPLGSPLAGRADSALDDLVGFFVNTLVLRTDTSGNPAFTELLARVGASNLGAYEHQDLPFEYLVEVLNPARTTSHHPLFQVMLVLQNNIEPAWRLDGLTAVHETVPTHTSKFDLTIELTERFGPDGRPGGLRGEIEYATDLFDRETVERFARQLLRVLDTVVADPARRLENIDLLDDAERTTVLDTWNATALDLPDATFPALFEAQVARTPDALALVHEDTELSYAALDRQANQVAHWLIDRGVGRDDVVGLSLRRSPELLGCLLGILKAGGVYLPLDPDYPSDRLAFMVEDTRPKALLTTGDLLAKLPPEARDVLRLDLADPDDRAELAALPGHAPTDAERHAPLRPQDLAYVIYTSGSTGRPKGVAVTHRGIPNLARGYIERFRLDADSRFLQFSSINFDPTFCEMCCTLLAGSAVILTSPEELLSPDRQRALTARYRPTHITFSPTILGSMAEDALTDVEHLMVAGEACPPGLAATWSRGRTMINAYGPTEATVDALYWECGSAGPEFEADSVPVGRPLPNTRVYVLDAGLRPVPPGVTGELYLAGHGLARGYLNRPGLTAERFVACPYGRPGSRMYRTGDLAKWRTLPSGEGVVDFVGRADDQVKIRGMRIELGEIEAVLDTHERVAQSAVVVREDTPGHQQLIGYVVPKAPGTAGRAGLADDIAHVDKWQEIHEQGYSEQEDLGVEQDFTGWNSSYDNQPIPLPDMREWQAATVARILDLGPRHVLEVGVGSGLILWQVAPHVDTYAGVDFSPSLIQTLGARVEESEELRDRVLLRSLAAHEIGDLAGRRFDTVVINSVAQYFPSVAYLLDVLRQAMELLEPGGRIFLGDIRHLRLLHPFLTATALHGGAHADEPVAAARDLVAHTERLESELLLDPAFFSRIAEEITEVAGVDIQLKRGHHRNELTDFRYEVVLHKRGADLVSVRDAEEMVWQDGKVPSPGGTGPGSERPDHAGLDAVRERIARTRPDVLRVTGIPNHRVAAEVEAAHLLRTEQAARVRDLGLDTRERPGIDPEAVHALAAELGYTARLTWTDASEGDRFDAVLLAPEAVRPLLTDLFVHKAADGRSLYDHGNDPRAEDHGRTLAVEVRRHAARTLPEHMVPAAVVPLDTLPLTPNGKLDTRRLPAPDFTSRAVRPPRTAREIALARLFADVLGLESVGVDDQFFDLGGDSIRSIQLVSRARAEGFVITPRDVFQYQTVEALVARAAEQTAPAGTAGAGAAEVADALPYWLKTLETPDPAYGAPSGARAETSRVLPADLAEALLTTLPRMFHADPASLALAALAPALIEWRGRRVPAATSALRIDLATPEVPDPVPVRLTPGPANLDRSLADPRGLARALKRVKEQVRSLPAGGRGYADLRQDQARDQAQAQAQARDQDQVDAFAPSQVCFRFDMDAAPAPYPLLLDVRTRNDGGAETVWRWDPALFTEEDVAALADRWTQLLTGLAGLTDHPELGGLTPSDVTLLSLKQSTLTALERTYPGLQDVLPLAPLQQGLLLHAGAADPEKDDDPYQGQTLFDLEGPVDADRLRQAAQGLLARHANLRASFAVRGLETPVQVVPDSVEVPWRFHDLTGLDPEERTAAADRIVAEDAALRFDLAAGPMLRFSLLRFSGTRHQLLVADHHILLDGWSMAVVWQDLFDLYAGRAADLPPVVPFRDYLAWLARQDRQGALDAWGEYLAGIEQPTRVGRPGLATHVLPHTTSAVLPAELTRDLERACARLGLTLNTALQAAWGLQLGRLTGRTDVVFGTTVSERPAEIDGIESVVGLLINTVPLRVRSEPGEPLSATLGRVQSAQLDVFPHRHLGLTEIQRLVGAGELFDSYYVFQNYPDQADPSAGADGPRVRERTQGAKGVSHYPLGITVIPGERLEILFGHHPDLFDRRRIDTIKESLIDIIEAIAAEGSA